MKNVIFKALTIVALIAAFTSCKKEEPTEGEKTVVETYGGKDSDGDYLTLVLTTVTETKKGVTETKSATYELYYGESKKSEDYNEFSKGTFKVENGGAILTFNDEDGKTTFQMVADGKKLKYDNGEIGEDHYAFELTKK